MIYNAAIRDLQRGDEIEGFYVLKGAYPKVSSNGKPFLNATLSDKTGHKHFLAVFEVSQV